MTGNLYWESCVFIRWLTNQPPDFVPDIEQYIADAKRGEVKIHFSTIVFCEIRPRFFKGKHGSVQQLFAALGSAFTPIDPNPNILAAVGQLRDIEPVNPGDPQISDDKKRSIGTADAIHLMSCLYLRDTLGVSDIVFHTFDEGKGKTHEGRCVPLLGFDQWYPECIRTGRIADVCGVKRTRPQHTQPDLGRVFS
jgi:hypothetical protein